MLHRGRRRSAAALALPFLVSLALVLCAAGQNLNGEIVSVVRVPSCTLLPRDDLAVLLDSDPSQPASQGTDGTKCGALGEDSAVTTVTLAIQANQVASQDNLVFTINAPDQATGATEKQFFQQPLILTFSSSNIVEVHPLKLNANPVAYGAYWVQSAQIYSLPFAVPEAWSYFTQRASTLGSDLEEALESPFNVVDNAGPVGRTGITSVCPSPNSPELAGSSEFYPSFPEYTSQSTGQFRSITADPLLLFCPFVEGTGDVISYWEAGYMEQIVGQARIYDIGEAPRTFANVMVEAGFQVPSGNATAFQKVTELNLSTLQDGADVLDPTGRIVGAMVNIQTVGPLGQPMQGAIWEMGSEIYGGEAEQDPSVRNGMRTDYPQPVPGGAFDPIYTTIPFRNSSALDQRCPIPAQKCSQIHFQDDGVRSEWGYIKPARRATTYGRGSDKNGQTDDFYGTEKAAAQQMCAAGMRGSGVAGYEQIGGSQLTAFGGASAVTMCEYDVDTAQTLLEYANSNDVSFTGTMPGDFNPIQPQYAKDANRLIKAVDGNADITYTVVLSLSADFVGDVVEVADGVILASGMVCGTPDNSGAGAVRVLVLNPSSTLAGSYVATASFDADDQQDYEVSAITPCTLSLAPRERGACDIGFAFSGPIDLSLQASVTLSTTVVEAGNTDQTLATAQVECLISAEITGDSTFGASSISALIDQEGNPVEYDVTNCPAYYACVFCQPDSTAGYFWCAFVWGVIASGLLMLTVGVILVCVGTVDRYFTLSAQKKALNDAKKALSTYTVTMLMLVAMPMKVMAETEGVHAIRHASLVRFAALATLGGCAVMVLRTLPRRRNRASLGSAAVLVLATLFLGKCPTALGQATTSGGRIIDVTSYEQYTLVTDPDGVTLDPTAGNAVTTVTLELNTAVQGGLSSFSYQEDFTVVPTDDPDEADGAQTSGTLCASYTNATCQATNRATFRIDIDQAVLVARLTEVEGFNGGYSELPYSYYYNWVTEVVDSSDPDVSVVEDLVVDGTIIAGECALLDANSYGTQSPFPNTVDFATLFENSAANADFLQCPANSEPPKGPLNQFVRGYIDYLFFCEHNCVVNSFTRCTTTLTLVANFQPTQPMCKLWAIESLPAVSADVRLSVTSPSLGLNDTARVTSFTSGLQGASAVTQPAQQAAIQIQGVSGGGGGLGPSLGEYLVTCTSDGSPLNMVPDTAVQGASTVPPSSLSFNPWRALGLEFDDDDATIEPSLGTCSIPSANNSQYAINKLMPEPCTLEMLTGVSDPYAMMAIINATDVARIGTLAGQWGVDRTLYARAPSQLLFQTAGDNIRVNMQEIVPRVQAGLGDFNQFFTGVPPFGRGFLDLEPLTAPLIMSAQRSYQYSSDPPNGAQPPPYMPIFYRNYNRIPNIWTRIPAGGGAPLLLMEPSARSYLLKATVTATQGAISYRNRVPNGALDNGRSSCLVYNVQSTALNGYVNYQVCNPNEQGLTANYRLTVTCGASSNFLPALGDFDPSLPPTARMAPASVVLAGVAPGECRNALTSGDIGFELLYPAQDAADGSNPAICVYDLTSEDTAVPSEMGLQRASIQCGVSAPVASQAGNNVTLPGNYTYAPFDYRDPFDPPYYGPDEDDQGGDSFREWSDAQKILAAVVLTAIVVCLLSCATVCCCVYCRSKQLERKLKNPQKLVQDVKKEQ